MSTADFSDSAQANDIQDATDTERHNRLSRAQLIQKQEHSDMLANNWDCVSDAFASRECDAI